MESKDEATPSPTKQTALTSGTSVRPTLKEDNESYTEGVVERKSRTPIPMHDEIEDGLKLFQSGNGDVDPNKEVPPVDASKVLAPHQYTDLRTDFFVLVVLHCLLTVSEDEDVVLDHRRYLEELNNAKGCSLLMEGGLGSGKTAIVSYLIHKCSRGEALRKYTRVLVLSTSEVFEAENIEEFSKAVGFQETLHANTTAHMWFVIIELPSGSGFTDKLPTNSIVKGILQRTLFPEATILVTCRPSQVDSLKSLFKVQTHYRLTHTEHGMVHYLRTHSPHSDLIISYLRNNHLQRMCANPLIWWILVNKIFTGAGTFEAPKTLTDCIRTVVIESVNHDLDSEELSILGSSDLLLERLPETVEAPFGVQCALAMEHLLKGHLCKDFAESHRFFSMFSLTLSKVSLKDSFRFGLVEKTTDEKSEYAYQFLDPVIIEFLAAFHLYKLAPLNQLHFLFNHTRALFDKGFKLWLRFFLGLVGADYTSHITMHNASKLMMNSMVDVLIDNLKAAHDPLYRFELIKAIHEAQEKSMFRKLASKHPAVLDISVKVSEFEKCVDALGTLASKSNCSTWLVSTASKNTHLIRNLQQKAQNVKFEISPDAELVDKINLCPKRNSIDRDRVLRDADRSARPRTEEETMQKFNQFSCRAVREILQRVLPMYSDVKLKGDSTNVSYVSFLTCGCFEESFLQHVKLFPLVAVHFLDGEKKVSSATPPDTLTATDRHNLEKHNGNSLEVVIMLRPLMQRLEGTVPYTDEEYSLVFSQNLELEFSGSSTPSIGDLVATERCIDCVDDYEINGDQTQQIVPPLPVVQKTLTARSQTAYPKAFIPPAPPLPTVQEEREDTHDEDSPFNPETIDAIADQQAHSSYQYLPQQHRPLTQTTALTGGGSSVLPMQSGYLQPTFDEQAVGEVQSAPRRQGPMKPGTVLYSSLPDKIPSDRIMQLPTQRHLIRKGGNGSIFSENVAGMTMAVKKTSYRWVRITFLRKISYLGEIINGH